MYRFSLAGTWPECRKTVRTVRTVRTMLILREIFLYGSQSMIRTGPYKSPKTRKNIKTYSFLATFVPVEEAVSFRNSLFDVFPVENLHDAPDTEFFRVAVRG